MTSLALLFTLAAIGISETSYLIKKRVASEKPACPINEDCTVVLSSKYNKLFFIHNDILGLLFYIITSFIVASLVIGIEPIALWKLLITILLPAGSLMSFIFTYLQWKVIKAWCFWCLMSAGTIWLMTLILLTGI